MRCAMEMHRVRLVSAAANEPRDALITVNIVYSATGSLWEIGPVRYIRIISKNWSSV